MTDTIQSTSATPAGDVRARNKDILFAALAQAGISKVSIEFDGAGDTRQIEDILVYSRRDNPAALRPQPGAPLARAGRSAGGRRPMSIYRIYNQDDIARLAGALPGEGRGLALGHRAGTRPQMDHHSRLERHSRRRDGHSISGAACSRGPSPAIRGRAYAPPSKRGCATLGKPGPSVRPSLR